MIVTRTATKHLQLSSLLSRPSFSSQVDVEPDFLHMVEGYFNKAAKTAGISEDRINFLRSPEFSLKFNLPYKTGIHPLI